MPGLLEETGERCERRENPNRMGEEDMASRGSASSKGTKRVSRTWTR